jgi:hypothetical protein
MAEETPKRHYRKGKSYKRMDGAGGIWCLGFIGALIYYLHFHSGTFWLVILAILKAAVWPAFLVYYLLRFMKI